MGSKEFLDACGEKGVRRIPTLVTEVHKKCFTLMKEKYLEGMRHENN